MKTSLYLYHATNNPTMSTSRIKDIVYLLLVHGSHIAIHISHALSSYQINVPCASINSGITLLFGVQGALDPYYEFFGWDKKCCQTASGSVILGMSSCNTPSTP